MYMYMLVLKRILPFGIRILASLTNKYLNIRLLTQHKLFELFLAKYVLAHHFNSNLCFYCLFSDLQS